MKRRMVIMMRMIPVVIIIIGTMAMSFYIYKDMVSTETESCWQRLEATTKSVAEKMNARINDNVNMLSLVADAIVLKDEAGDRSNIVNYLSTVQVMTIFDRLDIMFPDGTMLTQDGEYIQVMGELSYEELLEKGDHTSPRFDDPRLGKEVIYCFAPIDTEEGNKALLVATLSCDTLTATFPVFLYGGAVDTFVVDRNDGNYLMDSWHPTLGNLYEVMPERERLKGYEDVDYLNGIMNGESGRLAYVSQTNGQDSYMYYTPMADHNWELCVVAQEDTVFSNVKLLQKNLFFVGVVEVIILSAYFIWNIWLTASLVRNEERARQYQMEQAANEARSKFLSNMSHDIRTPLNGIVGMLDVIKKHPDNSQMVTDCIGKIDVATQYLITLANDMLDINEMESGKIVLANDPINLCALVKGFDTMMQPKAKDAEVTLYAECKGVEHPFVLGSEVHIHRILINLIGNAIKYNKENGKVWVTVEEKGTEGNKGIYCFEIKDTGVGMSEEFQKNMFRAFEQERNDARTKYQGYGLGLAIVKHLVQKMGGHIEIESKKGEGSIFRVILPLEIDEQELAAQKNIESQLTDLTGMRILLVEDNELNMEIAQLLLMDKGATITPAENGRIALDIFKESQENYYDVILMDIMMQEMDGCEATEAIRGLDRADAKTIPILAMTANAFSEEIERCKKAGMNEHIAKPLDMDKLMGKITKYRATVKG